MTNLAKYNALFCDTLNVKEEQLSELKYQGVPEWDSVGHMSLVAAIEDAFDIMMEMKDILNFNSYEHGKEVLKEEYDIDIE